MPIDTTRRSELSPEEQLDRAISVQKALDLLSSESFDANTAFARILFRELIRELYAELVEAEGLLADHDIKRDGEEDEIDPALD